MASILPGYEYDIFISYRQKDNNLDGWVTEFVNTLKNEIDATFKEDISIYFDENPHDGLLETHDVDLSLNEKVKALIFIPVISQTYCDPNCFAWQKEFIAFRDFARQDKLGLDIRVNNGNVAKRILPIKIHEIDQADKELYEKEVGGVMRSVDFIYKSAGVNRSLRSAEEHPENNLTKTIYRDQINKVANGVKEIITSVKKPPGTLTEGKPENSSNSQTISKKKFALPLVIALVLIATLLFVFKPWQTLTSTDSLELENKSIAVLPFKDLSQNHDKEYLGDGIASEIINDLKTLAGLTVIGQTSSFSFKDKNTDLITIGKALGVQYLLEGSIQEEGNIIRVNAQLIDTKDGSSIWTYTEDKELTSILAIQDEIASEIAAMFNETRNKPRIVAVSSEVQDLYYQAKYYGYGVRSYSDANMLKAINYYKQTIALDSGFSKAFSGLAYLYALSGYFGLQFVDSPWENAEKFANRALDLDGINAEAYFVLAYKARTDDWDWEAARKLYQKSLSINSNSSLINFHYGLFLACVNEADSGLYYAKKAFSLDPLNREVQNTVFRLFMYSRQYTEGLNFVNNNISSGEMKSEMRVILFYLNQLYDDYIAELKMLEAEFSSDSRPPPPYEVYEKSGIEAFEKALYNQEGEGWGESRFSYEPLEESFSYCNEQIDKKIGNMVYILAGPIYDPLRDDPRFDDLLKRMDLYKYK
jgi:TolB-like protein